MTAIAFIDTNVLLYAGSNAAADQPKRAIARQLLSHIQPGFSAQVLQEFYSAAVTKQRLQMTHDEALAVLVSLAAFPVCPISRDLVLQAIDCRQRYRMSYWDAAIIAAASQLGCPTIYSEDLSHGQQYDGVQVINPFLSMAQALGP
ncbi:MAG: PIN domain-containing protein [Pirellulaceae bacterium]